MLPLCFGWLWTTEAAFHCEIEICFIGALTTGDICRAMIRKSVAWIRVFCGRSAPPLNNCNKFERHFNLGSSKDIYEVRVRISSYSFSHKSLRCYKRAVLWWNMTSKCFKVCSLIATRKLNKDGKLQIKKLKAYGFGRLPVDDKWWNRTAHSISLQIFQCSSAPQNRRVTNTMYKISNLFWFQIYFGRIP